MHVYPFRRRVQVLVPVLSIAALLAVCCSATSAIAAVTSSSNLQSKPQKHVLNTSLAGTWSGQYSGAFSGTFTIKWTQAGSTLTGSITLTNPGGTYNIGGRVHGSTITFGAVGAGATYKGSVSGKGKSMSGTYQTPRGDGNWSAHKT